AVAKTIPRWEGVRGERMTYARYFVDGPEKPPYEFLFDLKNDPKQLTNLAREKSDQPLLQRMRKRCDELVAQAGSPMEGIGETKRRSGKKQPKAPAKPKKSKQ
ncbi:MAG: hypothetical protein HN675_09360, partial [Opitutae bacterium]|nr:hypothetical protein [Opitutae bacterium]